MNESSMTSLSASQGPAENYSKISSCVVLSHLTLNYYGIFFNVPVLFYFAAKKSLFCDMEIVWNKACC